MVQAPLKPLSLQLPHHLALRVTPEQFVTLAAANRELRLERTATGELIVNPPTGSETGYRNSKIIPNPLLLHPLYNLLLGGHFGTISW